MLLCLSHYCYHIFWVYFKICSTLLLLLCIVDIYLYLSTYLPLSATLYSFLHLMFLFKEVFLLSEKFLLAIIFGESNGDEFSQFLFVWKDLNFTFISEEYFHLMEIFNSSLVICLWSCKDILSLSSGWYIFCWKFGPVLFFLLWR